MPTIEEIEKGTHLKKFMSCSDKVAMWNVVGVQGAMLSTLIEPIYIEGLVVRNLFHEENVSRGLFGRINESLLKAKIAKNPTDSNLLQLYRLNRHKVALYQPKDEQKYTKVCFIYFVLSHLPINNLMFLGTQNRLLTQLAPPSGWSRPFYRTCQWKKWLHYI